ncbi:hypothetical protein M9H77_08003 [Catharanthus roseus]|uniref:Uncharacterized protein n=1 Tax=Catharanthus roseus TaxID=4058 RepID=A0ACC0BWY9_CATRO|nr:hypothetical protein M9H77_08003 [Catharanthus roseus]
MYASYVLVVICLSRIIVPSVSSLARKIARADTKALAIDGTHSYKSKYNYLQSPNLQIFPTKQIVRVLESVSSPTASAGVRNILVNLDALMLYNMHNFFSTFFLLHAIQKKWKLKRQKKRPALIRHSHYGKIGFSGTQYLSPKATSVLRKLFCSFYMTLYENTTKNGIVFS